MKLKRWIAMWIAMFAIILGGTFAYAQDGDQPTETQPSVEAAEDTNTGTGDALDHLASFELWELFVGTILAGIVIPFVVQTGWNADAKKLAAFAFAALVAIVGSFYRGELDNFAFSSAAVIKMILVVYGTYESVWKMKFLNEVPQRIESVTTLGRWK